MGYPRGGWLALVIRPKFQPSQGENLKPIACRFSVHCPSTRWQPLAHTPSPLTLGDLEMEVLEQLWKLGSGDVKAVHAALTGGRENHPNTVQSALERLFRKGVLDREKRSHAFLYVPRVTREELAARLIEETLQRVKASESLPALAAFVDLAAEQDPRVLDELERLLRAHRARQQER